MISMLAMAAMVSCTNEIENPDQPQVNQNEPTPIEFGSSILAVQTKAAKTGTAFSDNEIIGIIGLVLHTQLINSPQLMLVLFGNVMPLIIFTLTILWQLLQKQTAISILPVLHLSLLPFRLQYKLARKELNRTYYGVT